MPVCSGFIQVHTGWLGIFSQAGGLVRVMGKALRKVMIKISSHGPCARK
jgi:hypothetical protein